MRNAIAVAQRGGVRDRDLGATIELVYSGFIIVDKSSKKAHRGCKGSI